MFYKVYGLLRGCRALRGSLWLMFDCVPLSLLWCGRHFPWQQTAASICCCLLCLVFSLDWLCLPSSKLEAISPSLSFKSCFSHFYSKKAFIPFLHYLQKCFCCTKCAVAYTRCKILGYDTFGWSPFFMWCVRFQFLVTLTRRLEAVHAG